MIKRLTLLILVFFSSMAMAAGQSVPCSPTATPIATNVALTTYTDATVVNANSYYYTIAAINTNGNFSTTCSNIATAVIPAIGTHTVTLTWTASTTPNVTYAVFRDQAPAPPTNLIKTVN